MDWVSRNTPAAKIEALPKDDYCVFPFMCFASLNAPLPHSFSRSPFRGVTKEI